MDELSRYLKPVSARGHLLWMSSIALMACSFWGATTVHRSFELLVRQKMLVSELQRTTRVTPAAKPSHADQETERHWVALLHEREFSWYPLFAALERTSNPDIALLEFLPDKASGAVTLKGYARDMGAANAYLDALGSNPIFREVYLSHQKKVQQGPLSVFSFEIRLRMQ